MQKAGLVAKIVAMNLFTLIILLFLLLAAGYVIYGVFLKKLFGLNDKLPTPAHSLRDGIDYEPANKFYLLGQHLSAISAAGPIVGPILAGMWFGWAPAVLWIVIGGIFIGGVHDFGALVASIRHSGKSVAEIIKENMSRKAFVLFLLFLWFSLMYIITAFTDITANTFISPRAGGNVASSSMLYLGLALVMGLIVKKFRPNLKITTLIFIPLVMVCIYLGNFFPLKIPTFFGADERLMWNTVLLLYCFAASLIPIWLLLQPRGYLGGFFLTMTVLISFIGLGIGSFTKGFRVEYPTFISWHNPSGLPLFPLLFTTIACGACSGFHSLVSSGTTSKQLNKETDAKAVGYGGMLLESVVAIIALSTLIMLGLTDVKELKDPNMIYANGIAMFLNSLGINKEFALNFAMLAFATFVYDTLDVATRLGRYIFEELFGLRNKLTPYLASFFTLALPFVFLIQKMVDAKGNPVPAWKIFWQVFGSSNQLLAGFVLFVVSLWLFRSKKKYVYCFIPAVFMLVTSLVSLGFLVKPKVDGLIRGKFIFTSMDITALILMGLAVLLLVEGVVIFRRKV